MSQSPPTQPPPTPPPPAHDDSYREKYEQTVAEVEEANHTLALLLETLEQKTNQSKELQEIIDLLENEELPDARTDLEGSKNQLADLQQTSSGLTNELKAESTKNEEWRPVS